MLPSEFKKTWEVLVQESILDAFSGFLEDYRLFVLFVQSLVKTVRAQARLDIDSKVKNILLLLGAEESADLRVKKYLMKLLQDYSETSFPPRISEVTSAFRDAVESKVPAALEGELDELLGSNDFQVFIRVTHKLSLHMLLNEPEIYLDFSEDLDYRVFTKAEDFYCIDGFPKNSPPCVVVLPTVMRGNYPYQGLKPSVLIIATAPPSAIIPLQEENRVRANPPKPKSLRKPPMPPLKNSGHIESREIPQEQVVDLYARYKQRIRGSTPENDAYPPLQQTGKTDSKAALMALASRMPRTSTPLRALSSCFFESPGKNMRNKTITSLLSRKLSEAAKKVDRKAFLKERFAGREPCKLM